jgi:very-short-patch-repair endonuclease
VRIEPDGRRRYLDVEWRLPDGRVIAVEVDGALHLVPRRWIEDQLRQNEVVIGGTVLLRYPSIVVRDDEPIVVDQLRRIFGGR